MIRSTLTSLFVEMLFHVTDLHWFCTAALSECFYILPCVLFSGMYQCGDLGCAGDALLQKISCMLLLHAAQDRTFCGKSMMNISCCEVQVDLTATEPCIVSQCCQ